MIKLIALDLDGTLFQSDGTISEGSLKAIEYARNKGVEVVISTGRPYSGLPFDELSKSGIKYSINSNGSAIYEIEGKNCIFNDPFDDEIIFPIIEKLSTLDVHTAIFTDGDGISPAHCEDMVPNLQLSDRTKKTFKDTRFHVNDPVSYLKSEDKHVQKITLNFIKDENGVLKHHDELWDELTANPDLTVVCGGFNNIEFTKHGVTKGTALHKLCEILKVDVKDTMAVGDTGNDLEILKAAEIAVAMGNATDEVKEVSDYVTGSNNEDGVAKAIYHYLGEVK